MSSRPVTYRIRPRKSSPVTQLRGVYGVTLILARGHSLTDVVLLKQVLKARTCSPIHSRCKAVFLFHVERCKLGLAGLKIVWPLVVAQVPVFMLLQQAVERLR